MMSSNWLAIPLGVLLTLVSGLCMTACVNNGTLSVGQAETYCTMGNPEHAGEGGFSGPGLEGCIVGTREIGPLFEDTDAEAADRACAKRYDVESIPFADTTEWMDQTTAMVDRKAGCHYGAQGHLHHIDTGVDGGLPPGGVPEEGGV